MIELVTIKNDNLEIEIHGFCGSNDNQCIVHFCDNTKAEEDRSLTDFDAYEAIAFLKQVIDAIEKQSET